MEKILPQQLVGASTIKIPVVSYNKKYKGQISAPGMIFIQGGTFVKGNAKDNVLNDWNNTPTQQYVRSFFMDETEVTNVMYREYLFWLKKRFYKSDSEEIRNIYSLLFLTLVWRNPWALMRIW